MKLNKLLIGSMGSCNQMYLADEVDAAIKELTQERDEAREKLRNLRETYIASLQLVKRAEEARDYWRDVAEEKGG